MNYTADDDTWSPQRIEEKRIRLQKLSDGELEKEIDAGTFLCRPRQSPPRGKPSAICTLTREVGEDAAGLDMMLNSWL